MTKRVCGIGPSAASTSSDHAIDHTQHALDLAAEVGVARRVDDVDVDAPYFDRGVLGKDRDARLFEVVRIHDAFDHAAVVGGEGTGLASSWSTSVVLPWSTWAMMAMLRRPVARDGRIFRRTTGPPIQPDRNMAKLVPGFLEVGGMHGADAGNCRHAVHEFVEAVGETGDGGIAADQVVGSVRSWRVF